MRIAALCLTLFLATPALASGATISFTDFATFQAATTGLTTDNFETWPSGVVAEPFTNLGVSWTTPEDLIVTPVAPLSGSQSISALDTAAAPSVDTLNATLPGGITAVGGWVYNFDGNAPGVTLSAFDSSAALLGSVTIINPTSYAFIGLTSTSPIASIRFASTGGVAPDDFVLDDFTFGTAEAVAAPVPEPSTVALLALGLGTFAVRRWRHRKP